MNAEYSTYLVFMYRMWYAADIYVYISSLSSYAWQLGFAMMDIDVYLYFWEREKERERERIML